MRNSLSTLVLTCAVALLFTNTPLFADETKHHCAKANEATCCTEAAECCKSATAECCQAQGCGAGKECCKAEDGKHTCPMNRDDDSSKECTHECCKNACCKETKKT